MREMSSPAAVRLGSYEVILALKIAVWFCLGGVIYNYLGYPILLFLFGIVAQAKSDLMFISRRKSRRTQIQPAHRPRVAIIIAAFNEEAVIAEKVRNTLAINYPSDLLDVLIGLDCPTDSTAEILSRIDAPRVKVFQFPARRGKLAVIKSLAERATAEILVFSDANTYFEPDCVANLVRHFVNPKVGAVSGEEVRLAAAGTDPGAEGHYWKYESILKMLESRLHCLHSANGGVYAIRRELFSPQANLIVEDFQIPLSLRFSGHWIVYDPEAIAVEEIAPSFASQFERRTRIGAGNFQTLFENPAYLNPFNGLPAFAYWSHRVLRWAGPILLMTAFCASAALYYERAYFGLLLAQSAFYLMAAWGYIRKRKEERIGLSKFPLSFCSMNAAFLSGLFRYLQGRQNLAWQATPRRAPDGMASAKKAER